MVRSTNNPPPPPPPARPEDVIKQLALLQALFASKMDEVSTHVESLERRSPEQVSSPSHSSDPHHPRYLKLDVLRFIGTNTHGYLKLDVPRFIGTDTHGYLHLPQYSRLRMHHRRLLLPRRSDSGLVSMDVQ